MIIFRFFLLETPTISERIRKQFLSLNHTWIMDGAGIQIRIPFTNRAEPRARFLSITVPDRGPKTRKMFVTQNICKYTIHLNKYIITIQFHV